MTSRNLQIDSRHHHSRIFKIFKCNFYHSKSSCPSHSRSPASADNCMARWKSSLRSDMAKQRSDFNGPLFRPKKPSWIGSQECKVSHRKMTNLFLVRTAVWWSVVWCAVSTVGSFLSCVLLLQSSRIEHDKRGSGRNQFPIFKSHDFCKFLEGEDRCLKPPSQAGNQMVLMSFACFYPLPLQLEHLIF